MLVEVDGFFILERQEFALVWWFSVVVETVELFQPA